ncbi:AMP-binding protein [Roseibium aggregatum]|uniref:AMP-binding protein n=1 Tax=Roseibium aggregatum TaxID=187304 RepID=A0A926S6Y4_9HYPH|nr:AMP-binding protein [Roseibium aggregatum]MBD1549053.1 AMP-binding protein [Roseibium aggregatum]
MAFVGDSLKDHARARAQAWALTCDRRSWTWAGLFDEVEALARELASRTPEGARVGLSLTDPADLLVAFLAVIRRGGLAMVFDPVWPSSRRTWVERETAPDLVLDASVLVELRDRAQQSSAPLMAPDETVPFYAGFTSGSTGDPKGFCRNHRSWLKSFELSRAEFAIGSHNRIVIPGSLVHSLHLYGAVHGLHAGASVVLCPRFSPKTLADRLREEDGSVFYATPTQIHYVAEELTRSGPAETVGLVLASGAKWRAEDRRAMAAVFPKARLVEFYGASEMSFITISAPEDDVPDRSVGRAAAGVSIRIGAPGSPPVPPGTTGPIWVKSGLLFDRYICGGGDEVCWKDGWLTVGDHGFLDDNGFLYLAGREKRMIVTSGLNIYPEEVEQVLAAHPAVRGAAVFGLPDPVRGSRLVAAVTPEPGSRIDETELRRLCLGELGRSRTPRTFHMVTDWPLTPGGKTDLQKLEQRLLQAASAEAAE